MESKSIMTENNLTLVRELGKIFYGANIEEQKKALQEKEEALRAFQIQQTKQIVALYDNKKMTDLNELAEFFNVDIHFVEEILKNR